MLTARTLNRTLLERQHLLQRTAMSAAAMTEHLVGLQAQDVLPPYLSLWSRLVDFDPAEVSTALEERTSVRVLLMRGTIHLVTAADCLELRPLVQGMLDKITRNSALSRDAAAVSREKLASAGRQALRDGPKTLDELAATLARSFPGYPPRALANTLREMCPLVQVPPRGQWGCSGGVVYRTAQTWLAADLAPAPDLPELVRRYLRAFGPASPADMTTWSGVTGLRTVFAGMRDELVEHRDPEGRLVYDLADLDLADPDRPAPVRLLGKYDNLWLSHAGRDRVTASQARARWMGRNGGVGNTIFVDGLLEGLWRQVDGRVEVELFRTLTGNEQDELDQEVIRLEQLLDRW